MTLRVARLQSLPETAKSSTEDFAGLALWATRHLPATSVVFDIGASLGTKLPAVASVCTTGHVYVTEAHEGRSAALSEALLIHEIANSSVTYCRIVHENGEASSSRKLAFENRTAGTRHVRLSQFLDEKGISKLDLIVITADGLDVRLLNDINLDRRSRDAVIAINIDVWALAYPETYKCMNFLSNAWGKFELTTICSDGIEGPVILDTLESFLQNSLKTCDQNHVVLLKPDRFSKSGGNAASTQDLEFMQGSDRLRSCLESAASSMIDEGPIGELRRSNLNRLAFGSTALLDLVSISRISTPSPSLILPLTAAAIDDSRPWFWPLWSALAARTAIDGGILVRRQFVDLLVSLEPLEISVFQRFAREATGSAYVTNTWFVTQLVSWGVDKDAAIFALRTLEGLGLIVWDHRIGDQKVALSQLGALLTAALDNSRLASSEQELIVIRPFHSRYT